MAKKPKPKPKSKTNKKSKQRKGWGWRMRLRIIILGVIAFPIILSTFLVLLTSKVNPPAGIYMMQERSRLGAIKREWEPIGSMARDVALNVVASEDANFCIHKGFEIEAMRQAWEEGANRGGSTITQQVAKNVFLWHGRTYVRKGLELWFAFLIENLWSKQRILEVYLNVAEFDEGIFGIPAAARHYFGVNANQLSSTQAGRLAAILPSPKLRSASRPSNLVRNRARRAIAGGRTIATDGRADCF